jgi:hypothetical protein
MLKRSYYSCHLGLAIDGSSICLIFRIEIFQQCIIEQVESMQTNWKLN